MAPHAPDTATLQALARELLQDAERLAHWEEVLPFTYAGAASTIELRIRLRPSTEWNLVDAFAPLIGEPYTPNVRPGHPTVTSWSTHGRHIHLEPAGLCLTLGGHLGDEAPWDRGLQDALLGAVVRLLEGAFLELETERFSATPFEESLPHVESGPKAWEKLRRLTIATVRLEYQVESYFTREESANPELELQLEGPTSAVLTRRMSERGERDATLFCVEPGSYSLKAMARVFSFPGYQSRLSAIHRAILWESAPLTVTLRANETYRVVASVPPEERRLNAREAQVFVGKGQKLGEAPRRVIQLQCR